jgi:hypothetical protein
VSYLILQFGRSYRDESAKDYKSCGYEKVKEAQQKELVEYRKTFGIASHEAYTTH